MSEGARTSAKDEATRPSLSLVPACPGRPGPRSDEREPVERERWLGERLDRDPDEQQRVVVAGDPVARQRPAAVAAMDQDPLAVLADGDRDRFHRGEAVRGAVARVVVDVAGPEAVRTVVSVRR